MYNDEELAQAEELTLVYAQEAPPDAFSASIFLMGSLAEDAPSWHEEAIGALRAASYHGVVFVPVDREYGGHDKLDQVDWDERYLQMADHILCWTPDGQLQLPDSLTADTWGGWKRSGKIVFGSPEQGRNGAFQRHYSYMLRVPQATTLAETVQLVLDKIGDGAWRSRGEREVPLHIWRTPSFKHWYTRLKAAGNILEHAREVTTVRARQGTQVYLWMLHVDIFVEAENRNKANEVVIGRPSTSSVVLYRHPSEPNQASDLVNGIEVVMVREFRSPVSNVDGFVYELPGGSDFNPALSPLDVAVEEVFAETGLTIHPCRFKERNSRQALATMSVHESHLFSVELTPEEMAWIKDQQEQETVFGDGSGEERTSVWVMTVGDIREGLAFDRLTMGMVLEVALELAM